MDKERKGIALSKFFEKKIVLKIFAVVLAIIIWLVLSLTLYPTIFKTVNNVPIKIDLAGTQAGRLGLSVVNKSIDTVNVTIKGLRYEIGNYSSDDLFATIDTSRVSEAGEYKLKLTINSNNDDSFTVSEISSSTITLKFDILSTIEMSLEVDTPNVSAAEGYSLVDPSADPSSVKITGPNDEISKITRAVVSYNEKKVLSESVSVSTDNIVFYNGDTVIESNNITTDNNEFRINLPIYMKKTLPFEVGIQGANSGFKTNTIKYTCNPEKIEILSPNSNIENQTTLHLGYLQLKDIYPGAKFSLPLTLESGQIDPSAIQKVEVTINKTGYSREVVALGSSNIKVINVASENSVKINTDSISNIKLFGPKSVISKIDSDDIVAELNLDAQTLKEGSYTKAVSIYAPKYSNVWAYGTYNISIDVTSK